MANFPFIGASYTARSKTFDAQRCVNLYPEVSGSGRSKSVAALIGTPGLKPWATLATGPIRGMLSVGSDAALVAAGNHLYRVDASGASEHVGWIDDSGPVAMETNGSSVMVVTGSSGYTVDTATWSMSEIIDDDFSGADRVGFIDGYFIFNCPGTGKFQTTGLYDTDIDGLSFATAEGAPDKLVSLIVDHRELWLFGERSTEVWFNSGNADFPFERINGAFIEHGCAAKHSVAKLDNSVFWLGADDKGRGIVFRAAGYQPQRISTHALEFAIGGYDKVDDAVAYAYQQEGHAFYVLTFPSADATWVFDASTGLWHERAWRDDAGRLHRHRSNCHMAFAGRNLVGDFETGAIYDFDLGTYTDAGDVIPRIRACQHSSADLKMVFYSAFQIDMETGVGLEYGQGADPQAMLQWSDDGGFSWSHEHWATIGKIGARKTRVRWRRLGRARDRVFRLTITDPVKVAIVAASVLSGVGAS